MSQLKTVIRPSRCSLNMNGVKYAQSKDQIWDGE